MTDLDQFDTRKVAYISVFETMGEEFVLWTKLVVRTGTAILEPDHLLLRENDAFPLNDGMVRGMALCLFI